MLDLNEFSDDQELSKVQAIVNTITNSNGIYHTGLISSRGREILVCSDGIESEDYLFYDIVFPSNMEELYRYIPNLDEVLKLKLYL